jgi:DNA-binding response OmpR family regulator
VLISDSEPLVVASLVRDLTKRSIHCLSDSSSELVLDLARRYRPAVIVIDIRQRIDGRDLLLRLKRDPEAADSKVLILSAVDDLFTRQTCLSLGAEDYDVKPLSEDFVDKVTRLARRTARNQVISLRWPCVARGEPARSARFRCIEVGGRLSSNRS